MPVTLKFKLAKVCVSTTNKYGIEISNPDDGIIEDPSPGPAPSHSSSV